MGEEPRDEPQEIQRGSHPRRGGVRSRDGEHRLADDQNSAGPVVHRKRAGTHTRGGHQQGHPRRTASTWLLCVEADDLVRYSVLVAAPIAPGVGTERACEVVRHAFVQVIPKFTDSPNTDPGHILLPGDRGRIGVHPNRRLCHNTGVAALQQGIESSKGIQKTAGGGLFVGIKPAAVSGAVKFFLIPTKELFNTH
jgi:hypothetical protein